MASLRERAERAEAQVAALTASLARMQHEMETLTRRLLGPKSERLPPVTEELGEDVPVDFEAVLKKRRERQKAKAELAMERVHYPVPKVQRRCPKCGGYPAPAVGRGKVTTLYDYRPAQVVAREEGRETLPPLLSSHRPCSFPSPLLERPPIRP